MKLKFYIIIVSVISFFNVNAQDPVFTQFLLLPETLNPGFTGSANAWNAGIVHRTQWPNENRQIDTEYGFANNLITDNLGLGITVLNQKETFTSFNYFQFNAAVSYRIDLNYNWRLRLGLEGGFNRKDFNFGNLLLEDQIGINDGSISGNSIDPGFLKSNNQINFVDFSFGVLIDEEDSWFGASLKHLTRPNVSFLENKNIPLDLFLSVHGGYFFEMGNSPTMILPTDTDLLFSFNYMRQSQFNRLDIGTSLEMRMFSFGVIAATNPEGRSTNSHFLTSLNPFISMRSGEFKFGYSYDINTSKFGNNLGIHELTLTWQSKYTCRNCDRYLLKLKGLRW